MEMWVGWVIINKGRRRGETFGKEVHKCTFAKRDGRGVDGEAQVQEHVQIMRETIPR